MEHFNLGEFLKRIRDEKKMSMRELVERIKVNDQSITTSQISNIEKNKTSPHFLTLQKIVQGLDLTVTIVLDGEEIQPNTVTIISTPQVAKLFEQKELIELMVYCKDLTPVQIEALKKLVKTM